MHMEEHMKKLLTYSTVVLLTSAMYSPAFAASATGTASATVVAPLTIVQTTGLNFGSFSVGATGGTVVITQAGAVSKTGDVQLIASSGATNGLFTVAGAPSTTYSISTPSTLSVTSGANSMSIALNAPTSDTIGAGGTDTFSVGGTLTASGSQSAGVYAGTYTVSVNYN